MKSRLIDAVFKAHPKEWLTKHEALKLAGLQRNDATRKSYFSQAVFRNQLKRRRRRATGVSGGVMEYRYHSDYKRAHRGFESVERKPVKPRTTGYIAELLKQKPLESKSLREMTFPGSIFSPPSPCESTTPKNRY